MEGHKTAADTLDKVRKGANLLILTANQRIIEVQGLLARGDFTRAADCAGSLHDKLATLAMAQQALGGLADAQVVRCKDLEPGMLLGDIGEIESIGPCTHCGEEDCNNRTIHIEGGGEIHLPVTAEIAVTVAGDEG